MSETPENNTTIEPVYVDLTADIVSAYVSNNTIASGDLAALIATVHSALVSAAQTAQEPAAEELVPAVPVKKSVLGDYIICLEDGKRFKSLKRHLRTHFDMTPEDYRAKWNLPADYPMVAPNYAAAAVGSRQEMGLGQKQGRRSKLANKS